MKIKQDDLQGGKALNFDFTVTQNDIVDENRELGGKISDDGLSVSGKIFRLNQREYDVQLHITGNMIYPCARCLEPTAYPCDFEYDETIEVSPDSETIDLIPCIEECLFINEPYRVLCKEDCKGLCPHCGANLNHTQCNCSDDEESDVDPRLSVLKKLL